jgi:hypothetical protein
MTFPTNQLKDHSAIAGSKYSNWTRSQLESALTYAKTQLGVIGEPLNHALTFIDQENDYENNNHKKSFFQHSIVHFPQAPEETKRLLQVSWDARKTAKESIDCLEDPDNF